MHETLQVCNGKFRQVTRQLLLLLHLGQILDQIMTQNWNFHQALSETTDVKVKDILD